MKEQELIVNINSPFVTKKKFSELTGIGIALLNKMIRENELSFIKNGGETGSGAVLINMVAFSERAIKQVENITGKKLIIKIND